MAQDIKNCLTRYSATTQALLTKYGLTSHDWVLKGQFYQTQIKSRDSLNSDSAS